MTYASPLLGAAQDGRIGVVEALIDAGANVDASTNDDNTTPLIAAAWRGGVDVTMALLEAGANVDAAFSATGATALHRCTSPPAGDRK